MIRDLELSFNEPASDWNEALPIGNGRLGGMIFGKVYTECIQLNEDSVWYGGHTDRNNKSAADNLDKIRELINQGRISDAQELCAVALCGTPENMRHYEPLGNLYIMFSGDKTEYYNYKRSLDLKNGISYVSYTMNGINYKREYFSSYVDDSIIIHLSADKGKSLSFSPCIARGELTWEYNPYQTTIYRHPEYNKYIDESYTVSDDIQVITATCGGKGAVSLAAALKVVLKNGTLKSVGNSIMVEGADEATIILSGITTFRENNPEKWCVDLLNDKALIDYNTIRENHIADYKKLFDRVDISLKNSDIDMSEIEFFFQYGRYLLISSSRLGSLPANLQGIWNKDMNPMWGSKYTININCQMNYWPAEVCNLSECHLPLIEHIWRMYPNGKETAKKMYNCDGFVAHHNTDLWGDTAPHDVCLSSSFWVMGAAWLCLHIWEHYEYSLDEAFLEDNFILMEEACRFIVEFLTQDGDYLVISPSLSPENEYMLDNEEHGVICKGASMDNQIIIELFTATIKAARRLGKQYLVEELSQIIPRIKRPAIGKYGQIMEWNEDYEEIDPGHRHISHLFALYPGHQILPHSNAELANAARKTIERRLTHGGGHTGWSRAWIINMWARLLDGEEAWENVKALLVTSTLPNYFDNHPPFQIDGNFGCTAGIAEMLVQSYENEIEILPAIPSAWECGHIKGLVVKGNVRTEIYWDKEKKVSVSFSSDKPGKYKVRYKNDIKDIDINAGEITTLTF